MDGQRVWLGDWSLVRRMKVCGEHMNEGVGLRAEFLEGRKTEKR